MSDRAWVATRKGLFELSRTGRGWDIARVSFVGDPVTAVLPPDRADPVRPMIAALNLGHFGVKCHASDDAGARWHEIDTPAYPAQPEGSRDDVAWKLAQIWTLAASGPTIWAGTLPGGLFRSTDASRWSLNDALWREPSRRKWFGGGYDVPGIHSILEIPDGGAAAGTALIVGVSCGGVWASVDDGASWSPRARGMRASYMPPEAAEDEVVQDPHRLAVCAADPRRLWCQHHDGIWRSDDGATSWQRVASAADGGFGFAVAADPRDPRRAWFVPAEADQRRIPAGGALVVMRTDDDGRSFRRLTAGLPQSNCYDLVYRHGLSVSDDGVSLLMGSTTGGVWSSDDAGDSWQPLDARLPPVYAVAFERG